VEITPPSLRVLGAHTVLAIEPASASPRRILEIVYQSGQTESDPNQEGGASSELIADPASARHLRAASWSRELADQCRLLAWNQQRVEIEVAQAEEVLHEVLPEGWELTVEHLGRLGPDNAWQARAFDPQNDWRQLEAKGPTRFAAAGALLRRFRAAESALAEAQEQGPEDWLLTDDSRPECAPDGAWVATAINVVNGQRLVGRDEDPSAAVKALVGLIEAAVNEQKRLNIRAERTRLAAQAARASAPPGRAPVATWLGGPGRGGVGRGRTGARPTPGTTVPIQDDAPGQCQRCGKKIALYRPGQRFGPECLKLVLANR
jgi:hypothetical protein